MDFPVYYSLASIVAQSQYKTKGFRQRDIKFFIGLFSNWIQLGGSGALLAVHNTQIMRFIKKLTTSGNIKVVGSGSSPQYVLTRKGVITLIKHITLKNYLSEPNQLYLVWYFLRSYKQQIKEIVEACDFAAYDQVEVDSLLDLKTFGKRQLSIIDLEILRQESRSETTIEAFEEVDALLASGATLDACINLVSEKYPYELNSQLPLHDLLKTLPEEILKWELTTGAKLKARILFEPILQTLRNHKARLETLIHNS